jgi:hypothetical protein
MSSEVSLQQIAGYCSTFGLLNQIEEERGALRVVFPLPNGTYMLWVRALTDRAVVDVAARSVLTVPSERRAAVATGLAYVNYQILLGSFAMDLVDGEVSFSVPVAYLDGPYTPEMLERCLGAMASTFETHMATLRALCYSEVTPEDAFGLATPPLPSIDALRRSLDEGEQAAS